MNTVYQNASGKAARRLIPFLIVCYLVAFLDRVNVGFAALTMNKELGLTAEMFGFGAGIFFFGYFIFEVPSNLILEKVGARRWIARIMISWGVIPTAFAFVPAISAFEFRAVDGNARLFEEAHSPAQLDKLCADLLDRLAIVLTKVGDRLVIWSEPAGQPHHFEITLALALEAAARLHAIEIAINIKLEMDGRVIARPSEVERLDGLEAQLFKSSLSTNASITRTGLSLPTQSSRLPGNSDSWPRSAPSMNPAIPDPADSAEEP